MQDTPELIEERLSRINRRLSDMLDVPSLPLTGGGARALDDPLWVWGVVGGKDVGKSTLINALAGGEVVQKGLEVGEGTFKPSAYLHADDENALRARFVSLNGLSVGYHAVAPPVMHSLALIDLPDFDSLFANHAEQVRAVAGVLDGIIWLTTPKKMSDLRGICEIRRVLKDRANFIYVVNKMDWLLAQSAAPSEDELNRVAAALNNQIALSGADANDARCFLISAKHRTKAAILASIASGQDRIPPLLAKEGSGEVLAQTATRSETDAISTAASRLVDQFDDLRVALTTAPTPEKSLANKRANFAFQVGTQAKALLSHYQPRALVDRLNEAVSTDAIEECVGRAFPEAYCRQLLTRLNERRVLVAEWSASLFKKRIACWPMLGVLAWPFVMIGMAIASLRSILPREDADDRDGAFRFDGIALDERADSARSAVLARLGSAAARAGVELPDASAVARRFRTETLAVADAHRDAVIQRYLDRSPSFPGRVLRKWFPLAVLLWFPIVQPIADWTLAGAAGAIGFNAESARVLVGILSAQNMLTGLGVSVLILGCVTGAVYSSAVRDSFAAVDALRTMPAELSAQPLVQTVADSIAQPVRRVADELATLTAPLEELAGKTV